MPDPLYLLSPIETAWGYVVGSTGSLAPSTDESLTARQALEAVVLTALRRPPCGVAFSGGRDSSAVLAIATHVARREGLPDPVPITRVFPDEPESDERSWQELVVGHLGLRDWQRLVIHDELDVVGPLATRHLREHGIVWPPTIAGDVPMLEVVRGGSLLDGEGGDDVLGDAKHRVAPLARLLRQPRPLGWRRLRRAARAVAPAPLRARAFRRNWHDGTPTPWLTAPAAAELTAALERQERRRPLPFPASVRTVPLRRTQVLGARNRRILAAPYDVQLTSPLLQAEVVHAFAREGGVLGPGDRSAVLRGLLPDLLPDEVLGRSTKAAFTGAYMGRPSRELVAGWQGDGVDPALVDVDALRGLWRSDVRVALTAALLQQAWLATNVTSNP